ncbi:NAD(P)-dependent oxidoreductase [Rhizobium wenxiniae]|uniref:NAD(P)-dependent oxidoreductase n=1 Tax=Rhizobium wenxiniae TaxID=1737357 RepID=UPI00357104D5
MGRKAICEMAEPMRSRIACKASPNVEKVRSPSEISWVMKKSAFAVVTSPRSEETRGSIGEAELLDLGPDSFLINVGRGPIIDEGALFKALRERTIAGAAIRLVSVPRRERRPVVADPI